MLAALEKVDSPVSRLKGSFRRILIRHFNESHWLCCGPGMRILPATLTRNPVEGPRKKLRIMQNESYWEARWEKKEQRERRGSKKFNVILFSRGEYKISFNFDSRFKTF